MTASLILLIDFFFRWYFSDTVKTHLWESVVVFGQIMMLMDDYYDAYDVDDDNDDGLVRR